MSTEMIDAGVGRPVPLTRRSVIRAGGLAALAATVVGLRPSAAVVAAPAPADIPWIDQAEALLVELCGILPHLDERDLSNVSHVLDRLGTMTESDGAGFVQQLVEDPLEIGPGNRIHDQMDREDVLTRQVAVTHAAVVASIADILDAGDRGRMYSETDAVRRARQEALARYGREIGGAIDRAAFRLHMHRKYHDPGDAASCETCIEHDA